MSQSQTSLSINLHCFKIIFSRQIPNHPISFLSSDAFWCLHIVYENETNEARLLSNCNAAKILNSKLIFNKFEAYGPFAFFSLYQARSIRNIHGTYYASIV